MTAFPITAAALKRLRRAWHTWRMNVHMGKALDHAQANALAEPRVDGSANYTVVVTARRALP